MQKAKLSWLFILNVFLIITLLVSLAKPASVQSALAGNVVISEVQIGGATADDEFVELYNPTGSSVDLTGWRLTRKTQTGVTENTLANSLAGSIPANGFFLVAPTGDYTGSTTADQAYSTASRIAADNSVILYSDAGVTVVDKLGLGAAVDSETPPFATNPTAGQSAERKANSGSTADSMTSGADVNGGNGEDTDNNTNDFILRLASDSQNASSSAETPTASPAPSISPSPSASASASPSPSATASASPSASPSTSPSASPSASASASPSTSPSASASASIAPSATPSATPKTRNRLSCSFGPQTFKIGAREFTFNVLSCKWIKA